MSATRVVIIAFLFVLGLVMALLYHEVTSHQPGSASNYRASVTSVVADRHGNSP